MTFESWVALSLAGCGLVFVVQNDFALRVVGLSLFAVALSLTAVAMLVEADARALLREWPGDDGLEAGASALRSSPKGCGSVPARRAEATQRCGS
jgi:hypothetical protein